MKNTSLAFALLISMIFAAGAAQAALISGPSLNASLLYYQPVPASPGSLLDIYVTLENGGETARNIHVEFVDNAPFSLSSESERIRTIPSIPGQENALVKYKVRVGQDAVPGTNYVKVRYANGGGQMQTVLLPIDVFSNTVALNVENVNLDPDSFVPGSVGKVAFQLANNAPINIREGTVTLELGNMDLVPVGGGTNQQRFTDLHPGDTRDFTFSLAPSPDMPSGIYKIPVNISFSDQNGRSYTRSEYIGVRVGVVPELLVYVDQSTIPRNTKEGDLIVRFVNKGLSEIKFLDFQVLPVDGVTVLSESDRVYVGNIDEDDYETADLRLQLKEDTAELPIKVSYRDALNRPYENTVTLRVNTQKDSNSGNGWLIWTVVIVAIALVGVWGYRRWSRRK